METRVITFRCPADVIAQVDELARALGRSRTTMLLAGIYMLNRQIETNKGQNITLEELGKDKELFPRPESKGGRPRKVVTKQ